MAALSALALTAMVLLALSGTATQVKKARKAVAAGRRTAARRVRAALKPRTVARTRRKTPGRRR